MSVDSALGAMNSKNLLLASSVTANAVAPRLRASVMTRTAIRVAFSTMTCQELPLQANGPKTMKVLGNWGIVTPS
ncbi:Uncharacterised protein [Mycobacteroides abscessus]|nr:Uncharacterised protein [Mycobacteroides abscessus]SIL57091.1 Uncharacterised protein [Mycobacteroides abscessus subsp. abscessus]